MVDILNIKNRPKWQIITEYAAQIGYFCRMLEIGVDYGDTWHHCRGVIHDYTGVDITLSRVTYPIMKEESMPIAVDPDNPPDQRPIEQPYCDPRSHWYEMDSRDFWNQLDDGVFWDLIFVDGCHDYELTLNDIKHALQHVTKGAYILVHDVDGGDADPTKAWNEVIGDQKNAIEHCLLLDHDLGMGVIRKK